MKQFRSLGASIFASCGKKTDLGNVFNIRLHRKYEYGCPLPKETSPEVRNSDISGLIKGHMPVVNRIKNLPNELISDWTNESNMCFVFQETYPHTPPIWFSESDDSTVSAAIEKLCDTTPDNYNVSHVFFVFREV